MFNMAGSTRAEVASSSLDGPMLASGYPNGQRGNYTSSTLDRPISFRETLENRMMVSGPMSLRNTTLSVEVPPVMQHMSLEPFSTNELKNFRSGELRRVLGISVEDHSFGSSHSKPIPPISWEELKRYKASMEDASYRAKERKKLLQDSLIKLDKVRNIVAKKRQRIEISNEKLSNSNLLKIGSQMHQNSSDITGQRMDERTKNGVPSKRVRSSMADASLLSTLQPDGRNAVPMRQSTMLDKDNNILIDKDKNKLSACNGVLMPTDDKMRGQMKRKRSAGTMANRTPDGDRELKQAIQPRPNNEPRSEPRSRPSDTLGFRTGSSNGTIGNNKMDSTSQATVGNACMMPRNDLGNGSLSNDRRERSSGLDKERVTAKGSNNPLSRMNICEEAQLGSQSPLTKGKAARSPRTGSGVIMNTPNFTRSSGGIDGLEQPSCLNKVQALTGSGKRSLQTGSSSPPVARWGGQRREKISRTRRANVVSPVSNFDESQAEGFVAPDVGARLSSTESIGVLFNKSLPSKAPLKLKLENVPSPAAPSESEESGAPENKSKEKGLDNGEIEEGMLIAAHKPATFILPTKKNKISNRNDIGDGVRRQGRSGRSSMQSKACLQLSKEKLETVETSRPPKSGRLTSDKAGSKIGRSLSKKVSDRKGSHRPLQIINIGSSELAGESDDDHEELLAAARSVWDNSCLTKSGPFWKQMEPIFSLVSSEDFELLTHQINFADELDGSFSNMPEADYNHEDRYQKASSHIAQHASQTNLVGLKKCVGMMYASESDPTKAAHEKIETKRWFDRSITLSHRLLSAFILEEGNDAINVNTEGGDTFLPFASDRSPYCTSSFQENECGSNVTKYGLDFINDMGSQTNHYGDTTTCNGFPSHDTTFMSPSNFISDDELMRGNDDLVRTENPNGGTCFEFEQDKSNQREQVTVGLSVSSPYQCQFEHISLDDKIVMELHSIGLYLEAVPDLSEEEEIDTAISELKTRLYQQVRLKKTQLCKLEKMIQEHKECEMRNHEQIAMNMLVDTAYKKILGGRGSHCSSQKSGASKISKPLALAFAKRTLARCREFEVTGQSCFTEPVLRDVLFSRPVCDNGAKNAHGIGSGIAPNTPIGSHNCPPGSRILDSGALANGIERHGQYPCLNHFSEQMFVRNDPNRVKKKEALLDVVTGAASSATPLLTSTLSGGAKWKNPDKDYKDMSTKHSALNGCHSSLSSGRGERKTKAKPKQKVAQLSTSGNGLGRITETTNMVPSMWESCGIVDAGSTRVNVKIELASSRSNAHDLFNDIEDNIFTNLPLHGIDSIDELDVADGLGGQGQDIGTWLNVDDDALQDNDIMGLEIPMDDLSELKLNF